MSNSPGKPWFALAAAVFLALGSAPAQAAGAWVWPMDRHELSMGFDRPAQNWLPGHRGVDLVGAIGDEVFATKGVCIARLNRADRDPKRVIDATDY